MSRHPVRDGVRVLVVHTRYQQRGGEDAVVEAEVELLRSRGHKVLEYQRSNDDVKTQSPVRTVAQTFWSTRTTREVSTLIDGFRPDVMHVHNTLALVSPSVYHAARRKGVPVVQTLHNFRLICPQALLLREGRVCEDCVGRLPWRGALHGCYRGSRAQTAVVAGMLATHRAMGTWQRDIALYIALNRFCQERFIAGGLPAERMRVKPNFVDLPAPPPGPRQGLLFVGRLSEEKGIGVLAEALRAVGDGAPTRVVGDGPLSALLDGIPGVQKLGALPGSSVAAHMSSATALVLPSIWYENFPRTLVEAYACGLPVIASRIGALSSLVEHERTGLLFEPNDAADLARTLAWARQHPEAMAAMGVRARQYYEAHLTGAANYEMLIAIYDEAMQSVSTRGERRA